MACWIVLVLANYFHGAQDIFGLEKIQMYLSLCGLLNAPFLPERLLQFLARLALVGLFDIAALMAGFRLVGFLCGRRPASMPLVLSLGFGVSALLLLGLGLSGLWFPAIAAAALFGGWAAASRGGWQLMKPLPGWRPGFRDLVLLAALPAALISLAGALAPESAFDPLRCYLGLPKLFIANHRVTLVEHYPFSSYPLNGAMLYGAMKMLGGDGLAKLFNWHLLFACGAMTFTLAGGGMPGRLAVVFLAAVPVVWLHASKAFSDLLMTFFGMTALSLVLGPGRLRPGMIAAAGTVFGLSMGTKYTAIQAIAPMAVVLAVLAPARGRLPRIWWIFGAAVLAAFLPWLVKNWLFTGNPLYPLFASLIRSVDSPAQALAAPSFAPGILGGGWASFTPWVLFLIRDRGDWFRLGPIILAVMPLVFLAPRGRARLLTAYVTVYAVAWMATTGFLARYLIPAMPVFFAAGALALGADNPVRMKGRIAGIAAGMMAAVMAGGIYLGFFAVTERQRPYQYTMGCIDEAEHLSRLLYLNWRVMNRVNAGFSSSDRFYSYGELVTYYARAQGFADYESESPLIRGLISGSWTPGDLDRKMRQRRLSAFLYNQGGGQSQTRVSPAPAWTARELVLWQDFLRTRTRLVFRIEDAPAGYCVSLWAFNRQADARGRLSAGYIWPHLPAAEGILDDGDRAMNGRDWRRAERIYRGVVKTYPDYAWAWQRLAESLNEQDRSGEADKCRARAKKLGGS